VEQEYSDVWVEGEISNYRPAPSGHVYFTLKDAEASLPIVLFRRQAMLLRFRPEDGLHVLVRGRVSVYEGAWFESWSCGFTRVSNPRC
jgi:exodeoxyribonuclease VII large subunit